MNDDPEPLLGEELFDARQRVVLGQCHQSMMAESLQRHLIRVLRDRLV